MSENKQKFVGFIGGSYQDNNPRYDCQRTVNYYCQKDDSGSGKDNQVSELLQRPGLTFLQTLSPGPIRGMETLSNGNTAIIVSGTQVYQISSGASIPVNITGTMGTASGPVSIKDNGGYVIIVDGTSTFYTFQIGSTTLVTRTDPHFYPSSQVTYQDGFFLFNSPGTSTVFTSTNNAPEGTSGGGGPIAFPDSNFAVKQGYPDVVTGIISNSRELYVLGQQTTEVWFDSGASNVFTFQREDGKNSQTGCVSAFTIVQLANTIFWVGQNQQGGAIVYYMNGYTPERISTHAIERELTALGDLSSATAFGMQYQGHYFYVLQIAGSPSTWVYDVGAVTDLKQAPGLWGEWQSTTEFGTQVPFIASTHCFIAGQHLMGDTNNGNIYLLDNTASTDNGNSMLRMRQSPHVAKDLNNIFYRLVAIDFLTGQGLVNNGTNPDSAVHPRAVLQISNDGGQTFGDPIYTELGAIGQYYARARWQQLGYSRDRVFRVSITDPIVAHMISAQLDVEVGST